MAFQRMPYKDNDHFYIGLMSYLFALTLIYTSDIFSKFTDSYKIQLPDLLFCRSLIGIVSMLPWILYKQPNLFISPYVTTMNMLRILLAIIGLFGWYFCLENNIYGRVYSIYQINPALTVILAILILNEKVTPWIIIGLCGCFLGALLVINPNFYDSQHLAYDTYELLIVFVFALFNITQKITASYLSPSLQLFTMFLFTIMYVYPFTSTHKIIQYNHQQWLFTLAWTIFTSFPFWFYNLSFCYVKTVRLMPFSHFSIVIGSLVSYFIFSESMPISTWIGVLIIIFSSVTTLYNNQKGSNGQLT